MSNPQHLSPSIKNEQISIWLHQLSFLATGVCSTLGVQWLFYTGAASGTSFFTQLTGCVGSMLAGLLIPILSTRRTSKIATEPSGQTEKKQEPDELIVDGYSVINLEEKHTENNKENDNGGGSLKHSVVARLAIMDMVASAFVTIGFSLIGSGMYQVIFSSVVIWCAILSYIFMKRILSVNQWIAIVGTTIGLTFCALDGVKTNNVQEQNTIDNNNDREISFGTLMTVGGTFLYACVYVYADYILSKQTPAPAPIRLCFYNGIYTTLITLIYISLYTMPHLNQIIHLDPVVSHQKIGAMYVFVTFVNAIHAWNYFTLLESTGSVATGILQAIRAILVYGISHFWYCTTDAAQCFT
ncbi:hypothetical protein INT45_003775 [Circinella minor]|uniref:EamA domain-containing protein n=1 Tax=Circinella minor TaxID=1195481 RepID=A0A8H7RQX2_9FUNG|nr:hypothetical protein INT45_003775 [Circinella minor]